MNVMWLLTIFTNLYIITTCCYCPPSCRRVSDYRGLLRLPGLCTAAWSQRGPGPSPSQIAGPDTDNRRVLPFQLTVTNKDEMRMKSSDISPCSICSTQYSVLDLLQYMYLPIVQLFSLFHTHIENHIIAFVL